MLCLCFHNIGGLSQSEEGEGAIKLQTLLSFVNQYQMDIFVFTKHNTCWDLLPPAKQLPELTHGWWENSHWSIAHNQLEKTQVSVNQVAPDWWRSMPSPTMLKNLGPIRPGLGNGHGSIYEDHNYKAPK